MSWQKEWQEPKGVRQFASEISPKFRLTSFTFDSSDMCRMLQDAVFGQGNIVSNSISFTSVKQTLLSAFTSVIKSLKDADQSGDFLFIFIEISWNIH